MNIGVGVEAVALEKASIILQFFRNINSITEILRV